MKFAQIPAGHFQLGWRYTGELPEDALCAWRDFAPLPDSLQRFSVTRRVLLPGFSIATRALPLAEILGDLDALDDLEGIAPLCELVDAKLAEQQLRLPSEDELEAACGGSLFAWGMQIPDGIPYAGETRFGLHRQPNYFGLQLNSDPYRVELVRHAFKLGDGGCAICGNYPWPLAWLSLAPSFRMLDHDVVDCFFETLEETWIRPVQLPR